MTTFAIKLYPFIPTYFHVSNRRNRIFLFSIQQTASNKSLLYLYSSKAGPIQEKLNPAPYFTRHCKAGEVFLSNRWTNLSFSLSVILIRRVLQTDVNASSIFLQVFIGSAVVPDRIISPLLQP